MNRLCSALVLGLLFVVLTASAALAAEKSIRISVYSRTDGKYKRTKLADGTFKPEYFAISNGGVIAGTERDNAQEKMDVAVMVKALAEHLGQQNYFLAPDTKSADLLLLVQWGRTIPFNSVNYGTRVGLAGDAISRVQEFDRGSTAAASPTSPEEAASAQADATIRLQDQARAVDQMNDMLFALQIENDVRDQRNVTNAQVLGYLDAINDANDISRFAGSPQFDDLRSEIEEARYYIVITAYDFSLLTDKKERKVRWVTRISIRAQGNSFNQRVEDMVARAARYFGRDSGKLIREYEGTVEMGEPEVVGVVDEPETDAPAPAEAPAKTGN
jgi:hypothetical protein